MIAIFSLLIILSLSVLVIRIATVALRYTGLSKEASQFQARSAFLGVGYTTSESESIVNHPVRRKIIAWLMVFGNAGIITAASSLILSFVRMDGDESYLLRLCILGIGIVILWTLSTSRFVDRQLSKFIKQMLLKYTALRVQDYSEMLKLEGEYLIQKQSVNSGEWLCEKKLGESRIRDEGVNVLAIVRSDGTFIGAPRGETEVRAEDTLVLYGREAALQRINSREMGLEGDAEHNRAVQSQSEIEQEEKQKDSPS